MAPGYDRFLLPPASLTARGFIRFVMPYGWVQDYPLCRLQIVATRHPSVPVADDLTGIRGAFVHCFANAQTLRWTLDLYNEIGANGHAKRMAWEIAV